MSASDPPSGTSGPARPPASAHPPGPTQRGPSNAHAPAVPSGLRQTLAAPGSVSGESDGEPVDGDEEARNDASGGAAIGTARTQMADMRNGGPAHSDGEEVRALDAPPPAAGAAAAAAAAATASVNREGSGVEPAPQPHADLQQSSTERPAYGQLAEPEDHHLDATLALFDSYNRYRACGCEGDECEHGTWSPQAHDREGSTGDTASTTSKNANQQGRRREMSIASEIRERLKRLATAGPDLDGVDEDPMMSSSRRRKRRTTQYLAESHGVKHGKRMYLSYYFPFLTWVGQYRLSYLHGDLVAALTMASFYIPMALSYAENLAHVPPINGLYSFVFNPVIYALMGTVPQMVVGPEAPGSLLVGAVVRTSVDRGYSGEDEGMMHARIAGVVTGMAGAIIFIAGLTRLGFLESVLSRPFLRGFISAIGIVILTGQLIPEMGLTELAKERDIDHASSWDKLVFLVQNIGRAHGPTCAVSFTSFAIIMVCRQTKLALQPRKPWVAYIPDRFLVVVLSAVLAYAFRWEQLGVEILGEVKSSSNSSFPVHLPWAPSYMKHVRDAMATSFLIALLGFFESSVAAKSLSGADKKPGEGIRGLQHSANRELVALGVANMVGGCFMALPAFGGYGRSKVNSQTGGKTPMSSLFLSLFTAITVLFLLPILYYIPKGVLSAMVSVVAYSLIEEAPHDIAFFLRIRGWQELILIVIIFFATIFYSLELGIALGMGISILSVIRHATKPRIQILGKVPGTSNQFEDAEINAHDVEFIEGSLIVKIPEPLTFANTGDLRNRLRRLEHYGTMMAHPALPRVRPVEHNQNIIFDVHGVTSLDGSGAQVLAEIVQGYVDAGVRVFFCRVPNPRHPVFRRFVRSGIVQRAGGMRHFTLSVDEALRLAAENHDEGEYRDQQDPPV